MDGMLDVISDRHVQAISVVEDLRDRVAALSSLEDFEALKVLLMERLAQFLEGTVAAADAAGTRRLLQELGPRWRDRYYRGWCEEVAGALRRLRDSGALPATTDVERLASLIVTTIVGGYVLSASMHDVRPMAAVLEIAAIRVRSAADGRRQTMRPVMASATCFLDRI